MSAQRYLLDTMLLPWRAVCIATLILSLTSTAQAQQPESVADVVTQGGLQLLDWVLIGIYALSTILLGWYFGRQQHNTEEYFIGRGSMNPLFIGVSLFATLLSTITYLSTPGEMVGKGPVIMFSLLTYPIVYLVVAYGLLPVYMRSRVISAYALLELKLGLGIRLLGACLFVVLRLFWMSLLIYLASKAMTVMMGVDFRWTLPGLDLVLTELEMTVLATGFVAVIYTSLGGLRAVVVTDVLQTVLLYGGALLVIATITFHVGGFSWFPSSWHSNWDSQPFFSIDPRTRVTVVGSMASVAIWFICTAGGDQTSVQRFMATSDLRAARRACATQIIVTAIIMATLGLAGLALLGYFEANVDALPENMDLKNSADEMFPMFISYHLPVGISGLIVSAMFAAAMSSIDSGINSITAVVTTDFMDRFGKAPTSTRGHLLFAKVLAFTIGAIVVVCSSLMEYIPGNITAVTNKTANLLTTPIFGLFFFAFFVPFARPVAVWIATIIGTMTAAVIAFSGPLVTLLLVLFDIPVETFGVTMRDGVAEDPISFQWISPVALAVNLATGTLLSLLLSRSKQ